MSHFDHATELLRDLLTVGARQATLSECAYLVEQGLLRCERRDDLESATFYLTEAGSAALEPEEVPI